jgi:glycosyltransferase involved in cell wall biosynthesis
MTEVQQDSERCTGEPSAAAGADGHPRVQRVVMINSTLSPGGAERVICHLAREFTRRGVGTTILCLQEKGQFGEELEAEGVPVVALQSTRSHDIGAILRMSHLLRTVRPDIVHAHDLSSMVYGLAASLGGRCFPVVFTAHGMIFRDMKKVRPRFRLAARFLAAITAVSRDAGDCHAQYLDWHKSVDVILNGVPNKPRPGEHREHLRQCLGISRDTFIFLAAGIAKAEKGYEDLLQAAALLRDASPGRAFVVLVAGTISGDAYCRSLLTLHEKMGLHDTVRFLGLRDDIWELYAAADAFVLSSRSEGLPMVVLEAMMAGIPVVATKVGGVPSALGDGGLLVDVASPGQLSKAMHELLKSPRHAELLALRCRTRAINEYTVDRMAARYLGLFEEVVARRR